MDIKGQHVSPAEHNIDVSALIAHIESLNSPISTKKARAAIFFRLAEPPHTRTPMTTWKVSLCSICVPTSKPARVNLSTKPTNVLCCFNKNRNQMSLLSNSMLFSHHLPRNVPSEPRRHQNCVLKRPVFKKEKQLQ